MAIWTKDEDFGIYQTVPVRKPTAEEHAKNMEILRKLKEGIRHDQ